MLTRTGAGGGGLWASSGAGGDAVGQGAGTTFAFGAVAFRIGRQGEDMRALQEAVQCRGHQSWRAAQGGGPVVDAEVAGQNRGAVPVTLVDDFIEDAGEVV